jgi:acyl transferase domain-containing protein/thioesterase domain-containing protein/acyl carrier protein
MTHRTPAAQFSGDIAIVGLSVCVPGADSVQTFWNNLRDGVESIEVLDEKALLEAGERPENLADPNYVPAAARLEGFDTFDPDFFGFSPKEAAILDPQHRKFLEVAWEAMEVAGHPPESIDGPIGVYAGCGMGSYFYFNICSNPHLVDDVGMFLLRHTGNDKDFLTTRVSHVFDLKGPSVNIQTACSTSLVAVHYACKALRDGDCDMALAGGVTIELPQGRGYVFKENEILSPDGHCHAFDHRAQGTVFGSGAGAVALRRLEDAIADGDHIWAVIKGTAINNDGAAKAGYLAPSVDGQADAVRKALDTAGVTADTIDYVECHGTGTYLGDPIEVSALTEAYRADTADEGYCRIGSVKTNIGHLDTAAGVAGLAKTTLALHHGQIPPSLGYEAPNPAIDFDSSPFRVNDRLVDWTSHKGPRRAAVNALGVGGTNAHAILEAAPDRGASDESDFPFHILCLSAQSRAALDDNAARLARHLRANPDLNLADVSWTLKQGRRAFDKRRVLVAETATEAADLLESGNSREVFSHDRLGDAPDVVFMFPGGGAQYTDMARDLYETEPEFAEWMDRGLDHLQKQIDHDIRALWLPEPEDKAAAEAKLTQPSVQLPLIMIVEYALAKLWISWGVKPAALVGHSMGENTAACLAGVMSFEDCIDLVLLRGRLFDTVPAGGMLSVSLPEAELRDIIGDTLDIASVNAPGLTAVSGPQDRLDALSETLTAKDIDHQRIQIDIAAHSRMLDPILQEYQSFLRGLTLRAPEITIISNRTGSALLPEQATDPTYWTEQLRNTVMFAECISTLSQRPDRVYLEVGPGKALSSLAQMHPDVSPAQVLSALRHPDQDIADDAFFLGVIGRLWACGVEADWSQIWGEAKRHRLPLPTYAFQRGRYFIEPGKRADVEDQPLPKRRDDISDWGYRPAWKPQFADCDLDVERDLAEQPLTWLVFEDDCGFARPTLTRLESAGHRVVRVRPGDTFAPAGDLSYLIAPEEGRMGYDALIAELADQGLLPDRIAHFWLVTDQERFRPGSSFFDRNMEMGFYSLTYLAQALAGAELEHAPHLQVFTTGAAQVRDEPLPYPEKAIISGPLGVIPREVPGMTCASTDVELPKASGSWLRKAPAPDLSGRLLEELLATPASRTSAWRGEKRFEMTWRQAPLPPADEPGFRTGGTYLITGGFGGIGLTLAEDLLRTYQANVVLVSRDGLPPRAEWARLQRSHSPAHPMIRRIRAFEALEAIGSGALLPLAADVCNSSQMQAAIEATQTRFGPITGVIHAAGHIDDGPILTKTATGMAEVFAPKISGLRVLDTLFPDGAIEQMILFSSSSTATCPAGQVDYVAANEYLNAYARHRAGGKTRVLAVDWGVWNGVGMAAEAMKARLGGAGASERTGCDQPLLQEAGFDAGGAPIFVSGLNAGRDWVLNEHRLSDGTALMPGTGYVELAAEALSALGFETTFELQDLYFFRPLDVTDAETRQMIVRLEPQEEGFGFAVYSAVDGGYALNAQAQLVLGEQPAPADRLALSEIAARCPEEPAPQAGRLKSPQEAHLRFGPRWHALERTRFGTGEGLAELSLPAAAAADGALLHPGLMDLATGWAIDLVPDYDGSTLWVPVSYGTIRIHAPLPADLRSHVRLTEGHSDGRACFDITLADAQGQVVVEIANFRMQRLDEALDFGRAQQDATADDLGLGDARVAKPLSRDEQRLQHSIAAGIRPEDGPEALSRALATGLSQILVSSMDLPLLIEQAGQTSSAPEDAAQTFERPQLDTDFVAPRTAVEEQLAGFFQSLLGVSQVGVEDSFFDLGGHSLIAVRLFAQVKRAFGTDFPISVLFEAPTVAKLAELIGPVDEDDADAGTADSKAPSGPRFVHLVQLHPGDGSGKAPFFLVAGMFGNVLNLRQLALLVGRDRPVYGLQARGLIGDDTPHTTVAEAARDYLSEIREVQPQGPYLLGGFSGGGITAYEMAQQLKAEAQEVAALVMLDTPLPVRPMLSTPDKARIKLQELRSKGIAYLAEWARNRIAWELGKRQKAPAEQGTGAEFNNAKIEAAFRQAVGSYQLRQWDGSMTLFRPPLDRHWKAGNGNWISREKEYVFEDNQWTRWAPALQVIEVPGDHDSMVLVPNVSVLAEHLRAILDDTDPTPTRLAPPPLATAAE